MSINDRSETTTRRLGRTATVFVIAIAASLQALADTPTSGDTIDPATAERSGAAAMSRNWIDSLDEPWLLAGTETLEIGSAGDGDEGDPAARPECATFAADRDADLGEVLRAGCKPTLAQMSALMDNPLGNVAMLFTQIDLYKLENEANGKHADQWNYMGIAQFPKKLNKKWNLINRVVWNVTGVPLDRDNIDPRFRDFGNSGGALLPPSPSPPAAIDVFGGRTWGFGDMYYVGLFSPIDPIKLDGGGKVVWGAGFDLGLPTASEDLTGTGRWSAGPSGLGVYLGPKWKYGALVQQYWDFAGENDRGDVNLTNIQYFIYYSVSDTFSIGAAPNIIANWENDSNDVWTVPLGIGANKTINIGKVPVRFGLEAHYSVIQPDSAPGTEWDVRFYVIPALPSALFEWMQ